ANATEVVLELLELGLAGHALLGRQQVQLALILQAGQLVQALDPGGDRLEVGQQPAEPSLVYVWHLTPLGPFFDRISGLLLRTHEEDRSALAGHVGREPARLGQQMLRLQQVDDVDPVALPEDVRAHARVPPPRLVAEMQTGLQQFLYSRLGHEAPLSRFGYFSWRCRGNPAHLVCRAGPRAFLQGSVTGRGESRAQPPASALGGFLSLSGDARRVRRLGGPGARQRLAKVVRQRRGELELFLRKRVPEAEPGAVQELPREAVAAGMPVAWVARDRVTDRGEVGPDLVGAAGLQAHLDQGVGRQQLENPEMGPCLAGRPAANRPALRGPVVPSKGDVDRS